VNRFYQNHLKDQILTLQNGRNNYVTAGVYCVRGTMMKLLNGTALHLLVIDDDNKYRLKQEE
jgi:hypothetical protein